MVEKEIKILLSENEFNKILVLSKAIEKKVVVHTNHYFDTDKFLFDKKGATIRIRQTGNKYFFSLKITDLKTKEKRLKVSNEYEFKIECTLLKELTENRISLLEAHPETKEVLMPWGKAPNNIKYVGKLITERTSFRPKIDMPYILLDKSIYLSSADWELECEVENQHETEVFEAWLEEMNIFGSITKRGKYGRFVDRLSGKT
mgnify:CR=1 FL=1